ncbi:MAG: hypothetical protein E7271_02915 [Lachnospiraceae bacterium]|nr:hypothetical protein [Lachnospiraceae bacterium]
MSMSLDSIREPQKNSLNRFRFLICFGIVLAGITIGVVQKMLDSSAFNELPDVLQRLDIVNYFGRFAIWILIGTILSVYAKRPLHAAINCFLFFTGMIAGYYVYCNCVLHFLPVTYMLIWVVIACLSPIMAVICWYAKGEGIISIIISAVILGVLFSQAFLITQGFYVTHAPEVLTWIIGVVILYRKPKEFALEMVLSLGVAVIYQLFIPYWG